MLTNAYFPNGLSAHGYLVVGTAVNTTGNVFYVDSGGSSAADSPGKGKDPKAPFATWDYAVGRCTANNGDVIFLMPGHTETVTAAAGLALDVAGITCIGLGVGSDRPTVSFTTDVGADMDVDAANITIANVLFSGGIDALTGPIDINAADCRLLNIETRDTTGQATDFIVTDANADRLLIDGWKHIGAAADGADTAISIVGGDDIEICNFNIYGNFDEGAIENVTTAAVRINIHDGYIFSAAAEVLGITLVATTTGKVGPNIYVRIATDGANITEAVVGDDCQFFDPIYVCNADNERGLQWNGAISADL